MDKISTKALMDEFFKDKYPSEDYLLVIIENTIQIITA